MHDRRSLFLLPVLGVFLSGALGLGGLTPAVAESTGDLFEQYEVFTDSAEHLTVLPGLFLGGGMAEIAVVRIDKNGDRRVRMYGFDDGDDRRWASVLEATLGPEVLFVDVANIGGSDRVITFERGRLSWFDPGSATERTLVDVAVDYNPAHDPEGSPTQPGGEIPHVDITRDVNHDGRDDLVVPDVDGFWISVQMSDGSFTNAVKLGPPEPFAQNPLGNLDVDEPASNDARTYGDAGITAMTIPVYLSRVHEMDYNLDGRSDLVFWNKDHFDVHLQDSRGLFSPVAETFAPDVRFDSEGAYSRALDYIDKGVFSIIFGIGEKTERTVLHSLRDLNGDGVADLVTLTLSGRSIAKQRSLYEVHLGSPTPDGIRFARDVSSAIRPKGRAGGMQPWGYSSQRFEDFDGDGQVELMFRDVRVGIGGMMRALVGHSVPIDLEYYRMEAGIYPDKPTTKRKIRRFAPFAGLGSVFFPAVLMGDVNGDGRSDLLVGQSPEELHVFLGVPGSDLLARQPHEVAVDLPHDERRIWLVDLNEDGKQDILMHRTPTARAPTEPHRLTTLIAR